MGVVPEIVEDDEDEITNSSNDIINDIHDSVAPSIKGLPNIENIVYQASSPDEGSLVEQASDFGYKFLYRDIKHLTISRFGEILNYKILALLDFTSDRQRMSILVEEMFGEKNIILLTKGSDTKIFERINYNICSKEYINETDRHLLNFSKEGLRTLCFSYKIINKSSSFDPYLWVK